MGVKNTTVIQSNGKIIINGSEIESPKNSSSNNVAVINGKVYVDGYEFKNGEWKKTIMALWHKYF